MSSPRLPFRTASTDAAPIPDEEEHEADLPLTMTASVILTSLPRDAHAALAAAGAFEKEKSTLPIAPPRPILPSPSLLPCPLVPLQLPIALLIYVLADSNCTFQGGWLSAYFATADMQDLSDAKV